MKEIIRNINEYVKNNCECYDYGVEWDKENELLGLRIYKVDDDYTNDYRRQGEIIKKQLEEHYNISIFNYCEPSDYEVECMDVREQVYLGLDDLLFNCSDWLDRSVEVNSEWDNLFYDEREEDYF